MATDTSLAAFNQGLPTPTSQVVDFINAMYPGYQQYTKLQQSNMNNLMNSAAPANNIPYPDLSSLLDKVNSYYDQYAQKASDYATQRYQNAGSLVADSLAKKAERQGLGAQGTAGMTGPESAWRAEYAKSMNEPMNTNYSNIAAQAAMGKAGFASGNALTGVMNNVWQQNLQNQYNNNMWKMQLANQYQNNSNPFTQLASIGASLYRGGGQDSVKGMSGYGTGGGVSMDNSFQYNDPGFPGGAERPSNSFFPSDEEKKKMAQGLYGPTVVK